MLLLLNGLFALLLTLLNNLKNKYTNNLVKVCEYIHFLRIYNTEIFYAQ